MLTPFSTANSAFLQSEIGSDVEYTQDFPYMRLKSKKLPDEIYKHDKSIDLMCFLLPTDPPWIEGTVHNLMEPIPVMPA